MKTQLGKSNLPRLGFSFRNGLSPLNQGVQGSNPWRRTIKGSNLQTYGLWVGAFFLRKKRDRVTVRSRGTRCRSRNLNTIKLGIDEHSES